MKTLKEGDGFHFSVAMMCEDPEDHQIFMTNETMVVEKYVSIGLSLGEAKGAWKLHPSNFITQKLFFNWPIWHQFPTFETRGIIFC